MRISPTAAAVRLSAALVAILGFTTACSYVFDTPACGCIPPTSRFSSAVVAREFADTMRKQNAHNAWTLLTDDAQRHYGTEPAFTRAVPGLSAKLGGDSWAVIAETDLRRKGSAVGTTELLVPVRASTAAATAGQLALPVDSAGDQDSIVGRTGVAQEPNLTVRAPRPGATVRGPRPTITVVVPKGASITIKLMDTGTAGARGTDVIVLTPVDQHTSAAGTVRAKGRTTAGGYAYDWRPAGLRPGSYLLTAGAERERDRWVWNAVPITVRG